VPSLRALVAVAVIAAIPRAARAQDAFEIQVYDSETAPPGDTGFELHVNNFAAGVRTTSPAGELPTDRVTHFALEPHVGLASWCEAGGYLQAVLRPDGEVDYAGVKLRFKARLPRKLARGLIGLALNLELSSVPRTYEATGLGGELRPAIDLAWKRLYVGVNPILGLDFFGALAGHPQFEPAAAVMVRALPGWALGVEYYAAIGAIDHPLPAASQVHRLFAVSTLEHKWFGLHLGVGYGLAGGEKWIVKSIIGFDLGGGS
jgi:hypothetical protein